MRHPYADFLGKVEKPARYLGGEYQAVRKAGGSVAARVCLAFPDVYDIGMCHLGTKILYSHPQQAAATSPASARSRRGSTWRPSCARAACRCVSLETAAPLAEFDVVGFSLQYELTYTNVLDDARPRRHPAARRRSRRRDPLVLAGGPTATHPEPLAPFIDAFFIGDGEEALPRAGARGGRAARARACRAASALAELAATLPALRARAVRDRGRRRDRHDRGRRAAGSARARAAAARAGRRPQPVPVPGRHAGAVRRGDLRSHVGRDRARLHRGLPLLPGRDDLPPGARARSGGDRSTRCSAASRRAATTRRR